MRQVGRAHMILRRTHLAYHLSTKAVLTPEQVAAYNRLIPTRLASDSIVNSRFWRSS